MNEEILALRISLRGMSAFRDVLETPVMQCVLRLVDHIAEKNGLAAVEDYGTLLYLLQCENCFTLGDYLWSALRWSEGPYTKMVEQRCAGQWTNASEGPKAWYSRMDERLIYCAERDLEALVRACGARWGTWIQELLSSPTAQELVQRMGVLRFSGKLEKKAVGRIYSESEKASPFSPALEALMKEYMSDGVGVFARYKAFVWEEGKLVPVEHPDCPTKEELLGYTRQRDEVLQNTKLLMSGHWVNNVLLYGESGTGKSATVKQLLTLPGMEELRIIEADKENLGGLPALIRDLAGRRQKFIVFIDDLAFDRDDPTYSVLKTILEGGLERRPNNVAIYATSNRRHLVRQTISERAGDEMDRSETIREKTSLADRFGVRILFQGLAKNEFLEVVDFLAERHGLQMDPEELHRQAVIWERLHGAQTPRTALQFILSLQGQGEDQDQDQDPA